MSKVANFFFKLTGTEEKYTRAYLSKVIESILDQEEIIDFDDLYEKVLEKYPRVKVNRSAVAGLAAVEFGVGKKNQYKAKRAGRRNFFFGLQGTEEKYTEEYLLLVISDVLGDRALSKEDLFDEVVVKYKGARINNSAFRKLLEEKFYCKEKLYMKSNSDGDNVEITTVKRDAKYLLQHSKYISELNKYVLYPVEQLYRTYYEIISKQEFNAMDAVILAMATEIKQGNLDSEKCVDKCIDIEKYIDPYIEKIKNALSGIVKENYEIPCSFFIRNESVQKLLGSEGIFKAQDLLSVNLKKILVLSCADISGTILGLESLSTGYISRMSDTINKAVTNALKDRMYEVLLRRNGRYIDRGETLEAIGEDYKLTRERVRQIESKAKQRISAASVGIKDIVRGYFALLMKTNGVPYKRVADMLKYGEDENALMNACLMLEPADINFKYDGRYHIIYDSDIVTVEDIEKEIEFRFGKLFNFSRYNYANELEKDIIDNNYTLSGKHHNLYRLKKYTQTDYLIDLITELFPEGYRLYNEDDYSVIVAEYVNRLGDDVEIPSMTAVRGIVGRNTFCQVDKGTYKLRKECVEIPMKLFNDIYDFIVVHLPVVDYVTIYGQFEVQLKRLGIGNYYYLKGIIDYLLPDDLITRRNYITETDNRVTAVEARIAYMRNFEGTFTIDNLQSKYPGVKPYVFQLLCYDERKNGLIQIGWKKYIYSDKLNITNEQKANLKVIIEDLFSNTETGVLSSRKVFAKLKLSHSELLEEMPYIEDQFSMFSIIKYLFAEDYYLDRPYVSKDEPDAEKITTRGIILNHLNELDAVDYDKYKSFCMKMNISMIYTYMQLVDELSDSYVQLNDRQMVKKEAFGISEKALSDIEQVLELIFIRVDMLETSSFNGYMMFPQIRYKWNKHILAGIVRSYFSEKYEVINITEGSKSEAVDYRIERYVA